MATYATQADLLRYSMGLVIDNATNTEALLRASEDDIDRILPWGGEPIFVLVVYGDPTGGGLTITFGSVTSGSIPYNADAATVKAALEAMSNIGTGMVMVSTNPPGGTLPGQSFQLSFNSAAFTRQRNTYLTATAALTGGSSPDVELSLRRVDPNALRPSQRVALKNAVCAQAEYRIEMGPKFFRRAQYDSVSGPDFSTKGKLPYYAPKVKRELAQSGLRVTGARASSGVGSRPLGTDFVPPFGPGWPAGIERWWEM